MSEQPPKPAEQAELVLLNTVSRLGCTVKEAREHLARLSARAQSPAQPAAPQPTSKGGTVDGDEALL